MIASTKSPGDEHHQTISKNKQLFIIKIFYSFLKA